MAKLGSFALVAASLAISSCGLWNPADSQPFVPSRLPVGELVASAWLPAGLEEFRWGAGEEALLAALELTHIEWLQRAVQGEQTAEQIAMAFCSRAGLGMPVYYEPLGYSPYDKLHNWAARPKTGADFAGEVRQRVRQLGEQWQGQAGFWAYLIGHEDYDRAFYPALRGMVEVLKEEDPARPALVVGHIDSYPSREQFLDAFFAEGGAANIFQHEHYVFRQGVPARGGGLQARLEELATSYERVARALQGRYGRWHAIVQAQSETREGLGESGYYYRKPTGAELRAQVGLALSRGASGIVYFLYSSGVEEVRNGQGEVVQVRVYEGLVDRQGAPTAAYEAARSINAQLRRLSPVMAGLHFHGGFAGGRVPDNALVQRAEEGLQCGIFGDGEGESHLLVANMHTWEERAVWLQVRRARVRDALSGVPLPVEEGRVRVELEAGGFRLLELR